MGSSGSEIKGAALRANVVEERRALLQRVLWSRPLEKAGRIRELLSYVGDKSLSGASVEIHEQEIGEQVFGRPAGYDTTQDNIVRVTASQARKKIEQYFAQEGQSEPIVLEIPKGQYTPVFRERPALQPEPLAVLMREPALPAPPPQERRHWLWVAAAVAAPLLAIAVVYLAVQLHAARRAHLSVLEANPNLKALWSQILPPTGRTDLVVTDSSLSFFQELLDHQLSLAEYLKVDNWTSAPALAGNPEFQAFARRAAQHRFTSLANVTLAYRLAGVAGPASDRISLFSARGFNIRQMQADNVILLGSTRANPWGELIADRLNFSYDFDQKLRYSYFENHNPKPGESKIYRSDGGTSFCHIVFVPNLSRTGNILWIAGSEVEGTEGGGEFLTDEHAIEQLRALVPLTREGNFPYFEILLRSNRVGGVAPRFSIVAARKIAQ
jgi:hypothetical protein